MFLRCKIRQKNGKEHRTWSIVESRRVAGGRVVQRHVLYLGEINDSQKDEWTKVIAVFDAQKEFSPGAACQQERIKRRAGIADVHSPGGRWRESDADGLVHLFNFLRAATASRTTATSESSVRGRT